MNTITTTVKTVEIDFEALPAESKAFVIQYGLGQLLRDSYVSGKTADEREGLLNKKVDKLINGTLSIRESNGRGADPLAREITRLSELATINHFAKKGLKKAKVASADWTVVLNKFRVHPTIAEKAAVNVAAMGEIEVD